MATRRIIFLLGLLAWTCRADWSTLEPFQATMPRREFDSLLTNVYCPSASITNCLAYVGNSVTICSTPDKTNALFTLRFGSSGIVHPLSIRRIVLDPGHIGGEWARMEERFFIRGKDRPVQEAVLNLMVACRLRDQLQAAGYEVALTKNNFEPVTDKRPEDYRVEASRTLSEPGWGSALERAAFRNDLLRKRMEQLFYRNAEIAARAKLVNESYRPDLTICLHFNAAEWDEHNNLVEDNRLVVFVHGNYLPGELVDDAQKLRLFYKLLARSHAAELPVAEELANGLAQATQLPAAEYGAVSPAMRVSTNRYVYARNLAANRLIDSPVVFLEPYYMNNRIVYQRIQLGDYNGAQVIEGKSYRSIFREYADAVATGLIASRWRARPSPPPASPTNAK